MTYTHTERQVAASVTSPIGMHCGAPKLVPDPFSSIGGGGRHHVYNISNVFNTTTLMLSLDARCGYTLRFSKTVLILIYCCKHVGRGLCHIRNSAHKRTPYPTRMHPASHLIFEWICSIGTFIFIMRNK